MFQRLKPNFLKFADDEHHPSQSEESCKPSEKKSTELLTQPKNSKLANIASLLEKLQQLSVNKDEEAPPVDHIAFLCETPSPDHRYVSEILLASGLLMKCSSTHQATPSTLTCSLFLSNENLGGHPNLRGSIRAGAPQSQMIPRERTGS